LIASETQDGLDQFDSKPTLMMSELSISFPTANQEGSLRKNRWSVGRSSDNDLGYPERSGLSRQHLAFEHQGDAWVVCDLGSKNGTVLNDVRVKSKSFSPKVTGSQPAN